MSALISKATSCGAKNFFQNYLPSVLISRTAGLLKSGHISVTWRVLFHMNGQAGTVKDCSHGTIATSTSLSVSSFEVKILSRAERSLQNNSFEEKNCCRNHPVHQCIPSGCPAESPGQLSLLCPFFSLFLKLQTLFLLSLLDAHLKGSYLL